MASLGWSANVSCDTGPVALSSFTAGSTASGCYEIDKTFSDFSVTNQGSGGTGSVTQSASTIAITGATNFTTVSTPWNVTTTFTPASAGNWTASGSGSNTAASFTMLLDTAESFMPSATYPAAPTNSLFVYNVTFSALAAAGGSGASGSGSEIFCIGSSACTAGGSGNTVDLTFAFNGSNTITYGCTVNTAATGLMSCGAASSGSPITVSFTSPVQTLNFTDQYKVTDNGNTSSLTNFAFTFGEEQILTTPEPSALILLGTGLMGIFALRFLPNLRNRFQMAFTSNMVGSVIASQATAETAEGVAQGHRPGVLSTAWSSLRKSREPSSD